MIESIPYFILSELEKVESKGLPPVHLWHPDSVKDIDMKIHKDGQWYYLGTPITRPRMVRLFSTVLRKEPDGHFYLVTPVEKCRIQVEDVPFQAILLKVAGQGEDQALIFTTNVGNEVTVDQKNPLRFEFDPETEEPSPYIMVRDGLEARLVRSVYYQLAELCVEREANGELHLGVWSSGTFFDLLKIR